jgi:hypothetical protein
MKYTSWIIQRKLERLRTITAHISPYPGGIAPETRDFVAFLNDEAARHKTGMEFTALANRIEARGPVGKAALSKTTLGGWFLAGAIAAGFIDGEDGEKAVLRRGNSYHRKKLRKQEKTREGRDAAEKIQRALDRRLELRHSIEDTEVALGRSGHIPGHWPRQWRGGIYMPVLHPHNARVRPKATTTQMDSGGSPADLRRLANFAATERPGIIQATTPKKRRGHF